MLIAEDLLLLVTRDHEGTLLTSASYVDLAIGGALLAELSLLQRVGVAPAGQQVREGRLVVLDASPTSDEVLDTALASAGSRQGAKPADVVEPLGRHLRPRLYARLEAAGLLTGQTDKVLGLFPRHRWPAANAAHEQSAHDALASALRLGGTGDARVRTLIGLLAALNVLPKVVTPEETLLSAKELKHRAAAFGTDDWPSTALRQAINELDAATAAAIAAAGAIT